MEITTETLENGFVRLEPYVPELRDEVREVLDVDAEAWQLFSMAGYGEHFGSWWSGALERMEAGTWISFAIRDLASGRLAGSSSYLEIRPEKQTVEIGATFIHPDFRGGHVNPSIKLLMLGHAFDCGSRRVELLTDARNARSRAALAKLGAVQDGILRRDRSPGPATSATASSSPSPSSTGPPSATDSPPASPGRKLPDVRLIVARCEARYTGRLDTFLPEALRLVMIKSDGSVMIHADTGGYKPQNWMTPPTTIVEEDGLIVVTKHAGATEDRVEIKIAEVLSDVTHDMGEAAALERDGVEAHLQELLAEQPHWCGEGLRLVKREFFTDIGPVDLMCQDEEDEWVAVEIKRVGTIDAVEQITRYLERIHLDPTMAGCRGVLAAQSIKPQARTLAEGRDIACVEVDLGVLRGEREPDLTLFG